VEVVDLGQPGIVEREPLLKRVGEKGLTQALEGPQEVNGIKTHFIFLDYVNGQYEIEARQHDGLTGMASAVIRKAQTTDREFVARTAALLVNQDFGLVGTVVKLEGQSAEVAIRGGGLGVPLQGLVKKDEVFAVSALKRLGKELQAQRVPWALLRVVGEPTAGVYTCQIFNRLTYRGKPLPDGGEYVGLRCLKLGTAESTTAPLRLRFVTEDQHRAPISGLQVQASPDGFKRGPLEDRTTTADGLVDLREPYKHVAFVRVLHESRVVAELPVEIISDKLVTCPVTVKVEDERRGQLEHRRKRWHRQLNEYLQSNSTLFQELNDLAKTSRKEAIDRVKAGLDTLNAGMESLRAEKASLKQALEEAKTVKFDLSDMDRRLGDLQVRHERLSSYIKDLEEIEKQESDPRRQQWKEMARRAPELEEEAEFEKAIELYEQILKDGSADTRVKQRLQKLKQDWAIKDNDHKEARAFIYGAWSKQQDPAQLRDLLPEARKAFDACRKAEDSLTPQKLLLANGAHAVTLGKVEESLREETDDNRRLLTIIAEVTKELIELSNQVREYVRKARGPARKDA